MGVNAHWPDLIDTYLRLQSWDLVWKEWGDRPPKAVSAKHVLTHNPRFLEAIVAEAKRRWTTALASSDRAGSTAWHRIYCELRRDLLGLDEVRPDYPNGREGPKCETVDSDHPDSDDW